jgi:hypothetical protein
MVSDTTIAIFAIVAALGLLGLVVVETINMPQQQAGAAKSATGQCASIEGRTFKNSSTALCHTG